MVRIMVFLLLLTYNYVNFVMGLTSQEGLATRTVGYIGGEAMIRRGSMNIIRDIGAAKDEVYWGMIRGQRVIFFDGTDPNILTLGSWKEWISNVGCGLLNNCPAADSVATTAFNTVPSDYKDGNRVICVGFSRGNFFASYYANKYPNSCRYYVGFGSPGHSADPRTGARSIVFESISDPVSWLDTPNEFHHYQHRFTFTGHWYDLYAGSTRSYAGSSITGASDATLNTYLGYWGL